MLSAAYSAPASGGAKCPSSSWMPDVPPGIAGKAIGALIAAVVFLVVTMIPVSQMMGRYGPSFRVPIIGIQIGTGTVALVLKSLAAGALVQALSQCDGAS